MRIRALVPLCLAAAVAVIAPGAAQARQANNVSFNLELRLGAGVTYKVLTSANQCADDIEFPAGTTTQAKQTQSLGFDPSSAILDGCITKASWVDYVIYVTGPWTGNVRFSYGNGQAGGA